MLQQVPRYPTKTTTRCLKDYLEEAGFEVTQRTVQRDLKALSQVITGLQVDGDKDIPGWSWAKDTMLKEIPSMDANMALTFKLANSFLDAMFPPAVLDRLHPYFDCADNVLQQIDIAGYRNWGDKVRIFSRTQPLVPAIISEETAAVIYEALFGGKQIRARYMRRDGDEVEYNIHPLGLVFRESVVYLVATIWEYSDLRQLALHRFQSCSVLEHDAVVPEDFDLDQYLAQGNFEYGDIEGKQMHLKALFSNWAGQHLLETPLSHDQVVSEAGEGELLVEATVKDSWQLRWWLMGFGCNVEIISPQALRDEFRQIVMKMHEVYCHGIGE